ncbi:MAG: ferritin-like domain-containing protein [Verrucomicrobia bacterium]|nr:ferritin-like domain-containing protein [Verrucomicrobiota bacterium]
MELREFAEQVLFSTSLEAKLQCPANIADERPGGAIVAPTLPARPRELHFKPQGGAREFPRLDELEHSEHRGRLLHFFANHELLATELMALVLLRFPDAPAAFRRGVLQTLKDEQQHTQWYIDRMRACGVQFGDLPVSGYFWRAISRMENPMDYVAGLSLTFEQANLDFTRQFAAGFKQVGDDESARLLDRVYHDEVAHVAYGLKWFRKWKNPHESDWEAFCRQLRFPLSPQRAKGGSHLNVEGRRAAGLDAEFIAQLNVFAQSRGRTPSVFVFNPFAEAYIAQGDAFTPVQQQQQLARDLQNLPQFLCRQDDIALVQTKPSAQFLSTLKDAGFHLPEFVELARATQLKTRKLGCLRPWAWSPDSLAMLAPLFPSVNGEQRSAEQRFNERVAALYSKAWSASFLRRFLEMLGESGRLQTRWLCSSSVVGTAARTCEEALDALAAIRAGGHHRVVIKQSLGLAGHNAIRLWEPELLDTQRRWIESAVQQPCGVVVEPWLERLADFSMQFEMTGGGLKLIGYTGLINDAKGQFRANTAAPNFAKRLPSAVTRAFAGSPQIVPEIYQMYEKLMESLEQELRAVGYEGPLGIDALVYRDAGGMSRLKPIVEINPRYTMGRIAAELMKHTAPGSHGLFRIVNTAALRRHGFTGLQEYARALLDRAPLRLEGAPVARIRSGAVCLNDPEAAQACLAIWEVGREAPRSSDAGL